MERPPAQDTLLLVSVLHFTETGKLKGLGRGVVGEAPEREQEGWRGTAW